MGCNSSSPVAASAPASAPEAAPKAAAAPGARDAAGLPVCSKKIAAANAATANANVDGGIASTTTAGGGGATPGTGDSSATASAANSGACHGLLCSKVVDETECAFADMEKQLCSREAAGAGDA